MALHKLWHGDIAGYLADNADAPGTFWLFQHIPKTAGTSFRHEFAKELKPNHNICLRGRGGSPAFETMQQSLDAFLANHAQPPRFASGHLTGSHVAQIEARFPGVRPFTMLRKPEVRVLSDYRYQLTPKHPAHRAFKERFPTLESYVEASTSQNRMFHYLQRQPGDSVDDIVRNLEGRYAFVGITEMYPLCRRILLRLMGVRGGPAVESRNRTQATADNRVDDSPALLARVRKLNALDAQLYQRVADRLRANRDKLVAGMRRQ